MCDQLHDSVRICMYVLCCVLMNMSMDMINVHVVDSVKQGDRSPDMTLVQLGSLFFPSF